MSYSDQYKDCVWADFKTLERFMVEVLAALDVPRGDAEIVADVLISADKRGIDSHGIGRFKPIYIDRLENKTLSPITRIEIVKDTPATAVLDGNNGFGHVIARKATEMAIDKANKNGIAMTVARNTTHYGIAGYYALMAVARDMVCITGTNARPSIAPTFGVENMLGTNPLTIGMPTDEDFPFLIDCATSIAQRGKIEAYERTGRSVPEGWVVGSDGKALTEPSEILKRLTAGTAALAPLGGIGEESGGHKGYGYAAAVEILSSALQDGKFMKALSGSDADGKKTPIPLGHFFIVINPEFFLGKSIFKKIAGDICRELRNSQKLPGAEKIYTAGEKEHDAWLYRKTHGCPVPQALQKELTSLRCKLKVNVGLPWD
ncbi:MAG: Ldh family oxidoreductase [Victivallales bacterium]|nr:Ldh family oxidoreductase [Victivallales bacterium]